MSSGFEEFFKDYHKKNGINIDSLYYCEDKSDFKFYVKMDDYYTLDGARTFPINDLNKIFVNVSGKEGKYYKYLPIKSRFLYGSFEKNVSKFLMQNMEYQGLGLCIVKNKTLDYKKLVKIENKINSIKNLESIR